MSGLRVIAVEYDDEFAPAASLAEFKRTFEEQERVLEGKEPEEIVSFFKQSQDDSVSPPSLALQPTKKVTVTFQLTKPSQIKTIFFRNRGAALVEVLAGNNDWDVEKYEVVIGVQNLMQLSEATDLTNAKQRASWAFRGALSHTPHLKWHRLRLVLRHFRDSSFGFSGFFASPEAPSHFSMASFHSIAILLSKDKTPVSVSPKPTPKPVSASSPALAPVPDVVVSPTKTTKITVSKPKKPLEGVKLAISGLGGKERTEIREKAIELGAIYAPDWVDDCTHLISVGGSTPKALLAIAAKRIVVKKQWIENCHKAGAHVPEEPFALAPIPPRIISVPSKNKKQEDEEEKQQKVIKEKTKKIDMKDDGEDDDGEDTDPLDDAEVERFNKITKKEALQEETEKKNTKQEEPVSWNKKTKSVDPLPVCLKIAPSSANSKGPVWKLPSFFSGVKAHLYNVHNREKTARLLVAFGGSVDRFLMSDTTHLLTDEDWQPSFNSYANDLPSLDIVHSKWISDSASQQTLLPASDYFVPDE